MSESIDARQPCDCTCGRLRRASRRMTQIYDTALAPAGLTIAQFGLLAHVDSATRNGAGIALGELAERMVMDPTTLTRNLRPLETRRLLRSAPGAHDRRLRVIEISAAGRAALRRALPLWRKAQAQVEGALGSRDAAALRALLERAAAA
ncbi:MAG: MarR family winged helix-turn-helix transcriptional regulator [Vulcanimicrobiaceae bacterium]|jgi:DNA-binding MarR family transcriptional regulator